MNTISREEFDVYVSNYLKDNSIGDMFTHKNISNIDAQPSYYDIITSQEIKNVYDKLYFNYRTKFLKDYFIDNTEIYYEFDPVLLFCKHLKESYSNYSFTHNIETNYVHITHHSIMGMVFPIINKKGNAVVAGNQVQFLKKIVKQNYEKYKYSFVITDAAIDHIRTFWNLSEFDKFLFDKNIFSSYNCYNEYDLNHNEYDLNHKELDVLINNYLEEIAI